MGRKAGIGKDAVREGGVLVAQVHQLAGRVFSRILREHGIEDLNPAQGRIVYALWKESPLSQARLARSTRLDKSTLALMLDRLEAAGQVERVTDPADSRRKLVSLTDANRKMHAAYLAASEEMLAVFYRGFSPEEIDAFESALRRLLSNLEVAEAD